MSDEMKVVACTSCGARLKVKSAAQRVKCSKCSMSFEVASASANPTSLRTEIASSQRHVASQSSVPSPKTEPAESLGFFAYVWRSYNRTHSSLPFLLAMILSLLLMPVLSFLKPKIGVSAVIWSFGITLGVSLALFVVLVVIAGSRYLFLKQRTISDDQRSWLSAFICFLTMLTPALGIVAAAESFTPAEGLLVKLVPQFKEEQTRLLGDVAENSGEQPSESNDADSQVVSADSASTTQSKSADSDGGSEEVALADTKSSGRSKQTKSQSESSNEDGDQEVESTPKKTAQKSKTSNNKTASSDSEPKTKQVVAEGVGATKSEAEKDAFRNAVKQVVGAVVDAETLIKNDEVIEDKVLTYSDGFIKQGWETLSEKTQGGLVRIKIKVQVEQRSVVAKLKAANVTTKQVDGKGLFAEAVTKLDAEKDAAALLKKQFAELPTLLTASIDGEPQFNKATSEVRAQIVVQVDREAYTAYVKRLEEVLGKVAVAKDSTLLKTELEKNQDGSKSLYWNQNHPALGGPTLTSDSQWCIWVNHFNNASDTILKWNCYVVESDPADIVRSLEMPNSRNDEIDDTFGGRRNRNDLHVQRPSEAKTVVKLSALDSDGELITEDEDELLCSGESTYDDSYGSWGVLPLLRHIIVRDLKGDYGGRWNFYTVTQSLTQQKSQSGERNQRSVNLYVSPYALSVKKHGDGWSVGYYPKMRTTQRLKVTLEELRRIKEFKCEVSFTPATSLKTDSKSN